MKIYFTLRKFSNVWYSILVWLLTPNLLSAQYIQNAHRALKESEAPIEKPGFYGQSGATYVLTQDIKSERSGVFLGKDVTLDLNGYTLSYADGDYEHIPNSGFENGTEGWDLSNAPGAKVVNTRDVHIFLGDKLLSLKKGDEVVSEYIHLPLSNRSYYAMCGITGHHYPDLQGDMDNEMKISVYVEDGNGEEVKVRTEYGDSTRISSPVENKSPRLGGGFIVAHLNNHAAGRYRVRVKAETDCLIDEIDIRPAMDVGIGIVGRTHPMGHYDHLYDIQHSAFFDYTKEASTGKPIDGIPEIKGRGTVTIKNGTIKSGVKGIMSWGIQSTAPEVKLILENVKVITEGINAIAVDVPHASITHCTFEVDNPFVINRHGSQFYAVDLRGSEPSEVSFSEFYGGQGCLVFKGNNSSIHHNYFVNKQMVTNHYSIMAMGDSSEIFENRIEPEKGSGIEIYRHKGIEIFNNLIKVEASPPTTEYGNDAYSVAAIRIADYQAEPGSAGSAAENKVYNNTIFVTGRDFPDLPNYIPMVWAIYYSASGGENYIFGNQIMVDNKDSKSKAEAAAFYISGGVKGYGGSFYHNTIETNVPAAWVASRYGGTSNTKIFNNHIIKSKQAGHDFVPFRMGWEPCESCYAKDVVFRSNELEKMDVDITDQGHSFEVYWTLTVEVTDETGAKLSDKDISIRDNSNQIVAEGKTDDKGAWSLELLDYAFSEGSKNSANPYRVNCGSVSESVVLDRNKTVEMSIRR